MVTRRRTAAGFTYLTALFIVAMMGGGLALVGEVWHTSAMREREAELLHIGNEYRKAIAASPDIRKPRSLHIRPLLGERAMKLLRLPQSAARN